MTWFGWSFGDEGTPAATPLAALASATSTYATVWRCGDAVPERCCEGDASSALAMFVRYCARGVAPLWRPAPVTSEWLASGRLAMRGAAHDDAWRTSAELTGNARLAARVAMYAAQDHLAVSSIREAARLTANLAEDSSAARVRLDRVLGAAIMRELGAGRRYSATSNDAPIDPPETVRAIDLMFSSVIAHCS